MRDLINDEKCYKEALQQVYELMQGDFAETTPESRELERLTLLIEQYEYKYHQVVPDKEKKPSA